MSSPKVIANRYEVGELLGTGGEANVFIARDRETGADVALRISGPQAFAEKQPGEFHPNWVRLLDHGTDTETHYQIFELLRGETLRAKVTRSPLVLAAWLAFVRQSLDAVEALHEGGVDSRRSKRG